MGKIKPSGFAAQFDVKPLIPNNSDKFSRPPKHQKKKFRLKLRFQTPNKHHDSHKVKIEKKSKSFFYFKPIIPFFQVKQETDFYVKKEEKPQASVLPRRREEIMAPATSYHEEFDCGDPTYTPLSDEFAFPSSDEGASDYLESEDVLRIKPVNTRKLKVKKEKKQPKKSKKPRRRYKRRVLSDSEKLQASRRRRTCLVKKPKSQFLGVSWCNTKNTWVARVWHPTERKLIWAGYHQNERACALAVNEKCLDLKIPLKNPHIRNMEH